MSSCSQSFTRKHRRRTFEWARHVRPPVSQPEEAEDDEKVDDLLRVALHVQNERVSYLRWWRQDDDHLYRALSRLPMMKSSVQLTVMI